MAPWAAFLWVLVGLRPSRGLRACPRAARHRRGAALGSSLGSEERVFEVCRLDSSGAIVECFVKSEQELAASGIVGSMDLRQLSDRSKDDLLFTMPNSGADGETLFSVADFDTCLADETCEVPGDVLNKAYGPDYLVRLRPEGGGVHGAAAAAAADGHEARFHMHFGAGRLGLGLVVPAIAASGVSYAVVQRPKPRWQEIFLSDGESSVDVAVNDEVKVHNARVIPAGAAPEVVPSQSLVFGSSLEDLEGLLGKATSFSCSLGAAMHKVMLSTLGSLPELMTDAELVSRQRTAERAASLARRRRLYNPGYSSEDDAPCEYGGDIDPADDPRPVLFCAENDHAAVANLKRELRTRVRVVDCMVDRVCTGRRIEPSGVEIDAEPWPGAIVVLEPGFSHRQVPFSRDVVSLPSSLAHADYLSERKFHLVNGMHTVMAFETLDAFYEGGDREYVLLKYASMRRKFQRRVEAWRYAKIAGLLDAFGVENIMAWEGADSEQDAWEALLRFSDEVLVDRFSAIDDLVSRVLGGGVANRYQTRLRPTRKWMERRLTQPRDALSDFFLYAATRDRDRARVRVDEFGNPVVCDPADEACLPQNALEEAFPSPADAEAFVLKTCTASCVEAKRFCNKELEITHKTLIKEQRLFGGKKFSPTVQEAIAVDKARIVAIAQERRRAREAKRQAMEDLYDPVAPENVVSR